MAYRISYGRSVIRHRNRQTHMRSQHTSGWSVGRHAQPHTRRSVPVPTTVPQLVPCPPQPEERPSISESTLASVFMDNHHSSTSMVMSVSFRRIDGRACAGGKCGPLVVVHRAMRDRGLGPPHILQAKRRTARKACYWRLWVAQSSCSHSSRSGSASSRQTTANLTGPGFYL